jgi:integrase
MGKNVKVAVDKNYLRIQFPSAISQKVWGVRQKYKSLGLIDTPHNRMMAEKIVWEIQRDIYEDSLDPTLEKYNYGATLEKTLEKAKQAQSKTPKLLDLYTKYIESVKKPAIRKATYIICYQGYLPLIELCSAADIVTDSVKIFDAIKQKTTPSRTRLLLDILYNLLEWCKRQKLVNESTVNPYRAYKQDVPGKTIQKKPKHIIKLGAEGDNDFRGYSPEEAEHIIQAFSKKGRTPELYKNLTTFIFLTGCRPSEATGLRWKDVGENFATIIFRQALSTRTKEVGALKTARHGKERRKFPCGKRLQQLLKEMYDKQNNPHPDSFIFQQTGGNPVDWLSFGACWTGRTNKQGNHTEGVVEALIKEGKVSAYLKPYAMRHSFITWQLAAGMTPANVAKLVGNTPEVIYKHYVSADKDPELAFELE